MALDRLTKVDGAGINTTSDYRVGIITASKFVGPIEGTITSADATFTGNVTIGGTLTYEDVTNIDSIGIVTARNGLIVSGVSTFQDIDVDGHTNLDNVSIAGVTTTSDNIIIPDNKKLILGSVSGRQLEIFHNTSGSSNHRIESTSSTNHLNIVAATIRSSADTFVFTNRAGNKNVLRIVENNSTKLYFNGNEKLTTENTGVNITGIVTATSADINGDIDVDGHTNLDNVSVVGVSTFTRVGATAVFNSGAANDGRLEFQYNNSRIGLLAYHSDRLEIQTDSSKDFTIRTNGANERLRIDTGGRILTGGETATEVSPGGIHIKTSNGAATTQALILENHASNANTEVQIKMVPSISTPNDRFNSINCVNVDGNNKFDTVFFTCPGGPPQERFRIQNNGNVGIATTNAQDLLHIGGGSNTNLRFTGNQIKFYRDDGDSFIDQYGTGNISFRTTPSGSNLERLHIRSDGAIFLTEPNVNINRGTSGAGYPLTVRGPSNGDIIRLERANSGQWHFGFDGSTNFKIKSNTTEVIHISNTGNIRNQRADGNASFTLSRNASVTTTDQPIGVLDFASNTAHTVQARVMGKTRGTSNVGGDLVVETRTDGGSLVERFRVESVNNARARFNFGSGNSDFTNPDIGGATSGVSVNKNTLGQIYACTDNADNTAANDYQTVVLNVSRRNTSGDGPQIALDRGGWIKASIAGLQGSNTATSGPGSFAIYTHDYSSGANVRTKRFIIQSDGRVTIGDGNNLAQDFVTNMLIDGGDNTKLSIYGGPTGTGTIAFPDGSSTGAQRMAGFIQMNHTSNDNGPRLNMGLNDTTLVHIRVPGSNRGQLEIYGGFNESDTPAIEISDGGDARKVYLTNSSGDFNALTRNGSQTKGQLKMFESGILVHNMKDPDSTNTLQTFRAQTYRSQTGSTNPSISPDQTWIQKGGAGTYDSFREGNMELEVNGSSSNDHYQPVAFVPLGYDLDTSSFGGQWAGEMWIHQTGSQNPTTFGYSGYNTWATMSFKCKWDCAHWNAKPNGFWVEHYINQGRGNIGKIDASSTMSQFVIYLLPGQYKIRYNCLRGMSVHRSSSAGGSITLRDGGSMATYNTLAYSSRNTAFDSEISPGSANQAYTT